MKALKTDQSEKIVIRNRDSPKNDMTNSKHYNYKDMKISPEKSNIIWTIRLFSSTI